MSPRTLTDGELYILEAAQRLWGLHNTPENAFFLDSGEAVILLTSLDQTESMFVVLTTLANFRADGAIKSDEELTLQWLTGPLERES